MSAVKPSLESARYDLSLLFFPDARTTAEVCELIYQTSDSKLISTLSLTPYTVGRSFSRQEQIELAERLKKLEVGFVFSAKPPFQGEIRFDPRDKDEELSEAAADKDSQTAKRSHHGLRKVFVAGASLLVFGLASLVVLNLYLSKPEKQILDANFEARVESLQGRVEHRRQRSLQWENSSVGLSLRNRDSIRTLADANAEIRYREGQTIELQEKSLVVIGETRLGTENILTHQIELEDGQVRAELAASIERNRLELQTPQGRIEIESPRPGQAERSAVETEVRAGQLKVSVIEGVAGFYDPQTNQRTEIARDSELTSQIGQSSQLRHILGLQLLVPQDGVRLSESVGIHFQWENVAGVDLYELRIASDRQMSDILLSQRTSESQMRLNFIDSGTIFWQVIGESSSRVYRSPVRSLYVP
ncbi:MAG: hypothetical protein EA369_09315 [Bradymonadales bacterium]|nr:MAG: hypothetical protein EA369_09315 [Bradymonadales bacterium]